MLCPNKEKLCELFRGDKRLIYLDENKTKVVIFSGKIANDLLSKGYRIIQVLPDKRNKIRTVFVFEANKDIETTILLLTKNSSEIF